MMGAGSRDAAAPPRSAARTWSETFSRFRSSRERGPFSSSTRGPASSTARGLPRVGPPRDGAGDRGHPPPGSARHPLRQRVRAPARGHGELRRRRAVDRLARPALGGAAPAPGRCPCRATSTRGRLLGTPEEVDRGGLAAMIAETGGQRARRQPRPRRPARGARSSAWRRSSPRPARQAVSSVGRTESAPEVPLELLRRYNVAGPRYTSYPTAPMWKERLRSGRVRGHPRRERRRAVARPCLSTSTSPSARSSATSAAAPSSSPGAATTPNPPYLDALEKEIDWVSARAGAGRPVVQLHWGGGTPTYFPPELLERLGRRIFERFSLAPDAELGVEVDPRVTTREHLEILARLGFNRLSMGVQDFDPRVQESINRIQPFEATRDLVRDGPRPRLPEHQHGPDLRPALPEPGQLLGHDRPGARDLARPARRLLLRQRAVDEEAPERPAAAPAGGGREVRDLPHGARPIHRRRLRVHRDGPLRPARGRARPGPRAIGRFIATFRATRPRRAPICSVSG